VLFPDLIQVVEQDRCDTKPPRVLTALSLLNLIDIATQFGARDVSDANMAYEAGRFGFLAYVDLLADYSECSADMQTFLNLRSEATATASSDVASNDVASNATASNATASNAVDSNAVDSNLR